MAQNEMRAMRGMPLRVRSMEGLGVISHAAFTFDHQDAGFTSGMSYVFATHLREEDVACFQGHRVFGSRRSVVHFDYPIEYGEYFFPIVHMPLVRLIGPVEPRCRAAHVGDAH